METKIVKMVLSGVGLILFIAGIIVYFYSNKLAKVCTESTTATVIEIKEKREKRLKSDGNSDYKRFYYPVFEYSVNGETYKETGTGSETSKYRKNDKVELLYNPSNPKQFIIKGDKSNIIVSIILIVLGIGSFIALIIASIKLKNSKN